MNWELFLITFLGLAAFITVMAVGVIFSNKPLKGSCGGLNRVLGEDCQFCDKKDECPNVKEQSPA